MSDRQVTIAIDALGGENSPYKVLKVLNILKQQYKNNSFGDKMKLLVN